MGDWTMLNDSDMLRIEWERGERGGRERERWRGDEEWRATWLGTRLGLMTRDCH